MIRQRVEPGPGQESVWDYPRPPKVEDVDKKVKVVFGGVTRAAWFYPNPTPSFAGLDGYVAFYPSKMDGCWVGGRRSGRRKVTFTGVGSPPTSWSLSRAVLAPGAGR